MIACRADDFAASSGTRLVLIKDVVRSVAFEMGVDADGITGPRLDQRYVRARNAVSWIAREGLHRTFAEIARTMGGRDHSTIVVQVRRAEQRRASDPAFRMVTDKLLAQLRGAAK